MFVVMAKGRKTGGRQAGTPNKDNPLKGYIKAHSLAYFEPRERKVDGKIQLVSDFEMDLAMLKEEDRVNAEIRLLEFHQPKMKAMDLNLEANMTVQTIEDRLAALSEGEDVEEDEDN